MGIILLFIMYTMDRQTAMHFMQSTAMAELIVSHKAGEKWHLKENKTKKITIPVSIFINVTNHNMTCQLYTTRNVIKDIKLT